MTNALNRWLPPLTLGTWSGILLYFYMSGRLAAFLHPTFRPGVVVSGAVLLALALSAVFTKSDSGCCEDDACSHAVTRMTAGKLLTFAALILPLMLAVGISRDSFGLTAIQNRGVATDATGLVGASRASAQSDENTGTADQFIPKTPSGNIAASIIDLLYAAQDASLRPDFEGKTVEIVGQLMAENVANPNGNRMKVVRMYMTCCAADARPIAAIIELPKKTEVPDLSWVRVVGKPAFPTEGGKTLAVVKVESISVTPPPEETMLY